MDNNARKIIVATLMTMLIIDIATATDISYSRYYNDAGGITRTGSNGLAVHYIISGEGDVNNVRLYGYRYGEIIDYFDIEIWDKNFNTLYSTSYPYDKYFPINYNSADNYEYGWINISIPDVKVKEEFYVALFLHSTSPPWKVDKGTPSGGIFIGVSNSNNQSTYEVNKNPNRISTWKLRTDREKIDLMIILSIDGTYQPIIMAPGPSTQNHQIPMPVSTIIAPVMTKEIPKASVDLHGEKTEIELGDTILFRLSAVNIITMPEMYVQVIITPPSGMVVTSSEFVKSGAGQFTTTYELEPGTGKDIEVRIASNQIGDFNINGKVIYYFGDDKNTTEYQNLNLPIKVRPKLGSNEKNVPIPIATYNTIDGFEGIFGICILAIFYLFFKRHK